MEAGAEAVSLPELPAAFPGAEAAPEAVRDKSGVGSAALALPLDSFVASDVFEVVAEVPAECAEEAAAVTEVCDEPAMPAAEPDELLGPILSPILVYRM